MVRVTSATERPRRSGGEFVGVAGDVGCSRALGEVVGTVPGQNRAEEPDRACWLVGDAPAHTEPVRAEAIPSGLPRSAEAR